MTHPIESGRDTPLSWLLGWATAWAYGDDCPHYWPRLGTREDRLLFLDGVADAIAVHEGSRTPLPVTWDKGKARVGAWQVYVEPVVVGAYARWRWVAIGPTGSRNSEHHPSELVAMLSAERELAGRRGT
jgi:hypothetical protein